MKDWSKYQLDIFNFIKDSSDNLIVEALAGSGKTSTAVESLKYISPNDKSIFVAFNKKIAEELKTRVEPHITVGTLHSIGFKHCIRQFKSTLVSDKMTLIYKKVLGEDKEKNELIYALTKAVSLCKSCLADTFEDVDDLLDQFSIDPPDDVTRDDFINHIIFGLNACLKKTSSIDFDDMIYFPIKLGMTLDQYDNVFVDEAQDLNPSQIEFVFKLIKQNDSSKRKSKNNKNGRCIVFGDMNQAIYLFRAADANSFSKFKERLRATSLPLPITYRCPTSVVKEANALVPNLEPAPMAKQGTVTWHEYDKMVEKIQLGSYVISRTNAPLVKTSLKFLKNKIPCIILGRDIGENLLSIIKKSRSKNLDKLKIYVEKWKNKEISRLFSQRKDASIILDKAECLEVLIDGASSINELKSNINSLFSTKGSNEMITLGSTHQMKGLEAENVYILINTYNESSQEEKNLKYVAITRSKNNLYYVKYPSKKNKS